jgi:hypothetical protein
MALLICGPTPYAIVAGRGHFGDAEAHSDERAVAAFRTVLASRTHAYSAGRAGRSA